MSLTLIARPTRSRLFVGTDYEFETLDGASAGALRLRLGRPNTFESASGVIELSQHGIAPIVIDARRLDGTIALTLEHDVLAGETRLTRAGGAPERLVVTGVLLPIARLETASGERPLTIEAWKLLGKEYRVTIEPSLDGWSEEELRVAAALYLDLRATLAVLFGVAAGAGALATAAASRRKQAKPAQWRQRAKRAKHAREAIAQRAKAARTTATRALTHARERAQALARR